ncbi:MAG: TVP38/TMEM64 family protein [Pirellulales bacterium]
MMKVPATVRFLVLLLIGAIVAVGVVFLPIRGYLGRFLESVEELGVWGPPLVIAFYVIACLLFIPGSLVTLGVGFLFGVVWGTAIVSLGSTLGATAAFLAGRTLARGWIERKVATGLQFQAVDRAVGRNGFKIVFLVRLSPLFPFNLTNYAFGLTKIRLRDYVLASWIGMLPGTVMYVYLGSAVKSLADLAAGRTEGGAGQKIFFGVGLIVTVVATILVTRIARRALREAVAIPSEAE